MKSYLLFLFVCFCFITNCFSQMPAGMTLWLKADAGVYIDAGVTPATNNTLVYKWEDQSGNGNDFIQANSSYQPVYKTNALCSRPVLRFEVARRTYLESALLMAGAQTVFIVFVMPAMNNAANTFLSLKSSTNQFAEIIATDFSGYRPISFIAGLSSTAGGSFYQSSVGVNVSFASQGNMVCVTYNGGTNTSPASYSVNYDNLTPPVLSGGLLGRYTGDGTTIGGRAPAQNINFLNGDLAEIIVFNRVLNSAEITDVSGYLISKYGLLNNCALPVKLKSFNAYKSGQTIKLKWTAEELHLSHYDVEQSKDGVSWNKLGTIKASNAATETNYTFNDQTPSEGWNFYRLAAVDDDGSIGYSIIKKVLFQEPGSIQLFPNPARNSFIIQHHSSTLLDLSVYNSLGVMVKKVHRFANQKIFIDDLPAGVYHLKVKADNQIAGMSFIKQ